MMGYERSDTETTDVVAYVVNEEMHEVEVSNIDTCKVTEKSPNYYLNSKQQIRS